MACLQSLPACLEMQIGKESSGVAVCVWPLPRCACEGGNRVEARMVGLLHVPRELRRMGDGEAPGGNLKPASFQGPGSRQEQSCQRYPTVCAENSDMNSFFLLVSCPWLWGLEGQRCVSASEGGFWLSPWSRFSDFLIGDLHQVTLRGTLASR